MKNFCVSYELHQPDEDREAGLRTALEVFEDRCHALPSLWFISTPWTVYWFSENRKFVFEEVASFRN